MAKSTRTAARRPARATRAKRATAAKRPARRARAKAAAAKRPAGGARRKATAAKRPTGGARTKKAPARRAATTTRARRAAARRAAAPPAPAREHVARRQPETLRLSSIAPTLTVDDLGRSLAWYRDVVGFVVGERWESDGKLQGVELRAGSVTWYLTQDDFAKGRDRPKGIGFRFYCETTQDVDALAQRIKDAGGTLTQEPADTPWGSRQFTVQDPDGFTISIVRQR